MLRTLLSEFRKCRRTYIFALALLPGLGLVALKVLVFALRGPESLGPERWNQASFTNAALFLWERLALPFLTVSAAAWTAWLENNGNAWKLLLAQPVRRSSLFASKLALTIALISLCEFSWAASHLIGSSALGLPGGGMLELLAKRMTLALCGVLPIAAAQHWISSRSHQPAWPLGAGIAGILAAAPLSGTWLGNWLPWGFPWRTAVSDLSWSVLAPPLAVFGVLALAGTLHFQRKQA